MAIFNGVKKRNAILSAVLLAFNSFFIMSLIEAPCNLAYANANAASNEALEAKIIAQELAKQKKTEKKALISELVDEGRKHYEAKNYETAIETFQKVLQVDPANRTAKHYIELCKDTMTKEMPTTVSESMVKRGKDNFKKKQYSAAVADFETALAANPNDEEARAWLAKARESEGFILREKSAKAQSKTLKVARGVSEKEKDTSEQAMMLEVDKGWLPPEKLPREEMIIEEIISPEELAEQEAKKKLEQKMASVIVPAITITDADVQDLIRQLMEMTGVTIVLDERSLAELTKEQPIRISLTTATPLPLLDVLNIAFKATELGYKVEPNYVWISNRANVAREEMVTRTYRLKYGVRKTRKVALEEFGKTEEKK